MLTDEQIVKKLYDQPHMFKHYMMRKEYLKASRVRNHAAAIALFIEMEEDKREELFGSRQDLENIKPGMFGEDQVMKADLWVVLHGKGLDSTTYEDSMEILWAKK